MSIKNKKYVLAAAVVAFLCNFALFLIKMYVGLASNSISIYSDGINNLFDSVLDFFVSLVTVLTLVLTKSGGYAFDAAAGVIIGVIIIAGALKLVASSVKELIFS